MKKNHTRTIAIVVAILAALVYLQFRSWRTFDWTEFWRQTRGVNLWHIAIAVGFIYLSYVLRAFRWALFLRPTKRTTVRRMLAPQFIGFAALGLFGRAGEFVRPYLIARQEELTLESQLAVWTVERAFDLGAVLTLMFIFLVAVQGRVSHILFGAVHSGVTALAHKIQHNVLGAVVAAIVFVLFVILVRKLAGRASRGILHRIEAFKKGFNTIQDARSFVLIAVLSLACWFGIAQAYVHILHAYPPTDHTVTLDDGTSETRTSHLQVMGLEDVLLLMGGSMFGSVLQLPGGVGGSQLAIVNLLSSSVFTVAPFNVTKEVALSCGMMCWLVTFMSVIPAGLMMARWERVNLRTVEDESEAADESADDGAKA